MREQLPAGQDLRSFQLSDGSTLEYILDVTVDADRPLLVFHHGTPAAGPIDADLLDVAREIGFRTVELVRPGYGGTRKPGRTVADNAQLTSELVSHLGASVFTSSGWSGGGPHTLADAALLPNCLGALCIAGVAPFDEPDIDFLAGMGQDNIDEFSAAGDPAALEAFLASMAVELADVTNESVRTAMASLLPPADIAHIQHSTSDLAAALRWSVAEGMWGWFDDDIAFINNWGFDVRSIARPTFVLQGAEDLMVPFTHGQWLARTIPGTRAILAHGEGHLSIAEQHLGGALRELMALFPTAN